MTGTSKAQELAERRAEAGRLYRDGHGIAAIAELLNVDPSTTSRDLKVLRGQLLARSVEDVRSRIAEELVKLDALELENLLAWERSKGVRAKRMVKHNSQGDVVSTEDTTEQMLGDPRYLANVQRCIERRCALLGLDAPRQVNVTGMEPAPSKILVGCNIEDLV